nr:hypothetical protein [Torque teno midi virus]
MAFPPKMYRVPFLDAWGKQQQWIQSVELHHDNWCGCTNWFAHLLDSVIPLDSKNRGKTIQEIIEHSKNQIRALPALPLQPWPGTSDNGGDQGTGDDGNAGDGPEEKEDFAEPIPEDEVFALLENAANDENVPGKHSLYPIQSNKQYKSWIRKNKSQKHFSTLGTTDEGLLLNQLLKECTKTSQMQSLLQQMVQKNQTHPGKKEDAETHRARKKKTTAFYRTSKKSAKRHKKHRETSSSSSTTSGSSNSTKTSTS